jgi:hypothetical protein
VTVSISVTVTVTVTVDRVRDRDCNRDFDRDRDLDHHTPISPNPCCVEGASFLLAARTVRVEASLELSMLPVAVCRDLRVARSWSQS